MQKCALTKHTREHANSHALSNEAYTNKRARTHTISFSSTCYISTFVFENFPVTVCRAY